MANYYELTKSVRITTDGPIDGDRYVAATIADRDLILTNDRAFNGLQVYVVDASSDPAISAGPVLYLLIDKTTPVWNQIPLISPGGELGASNFIELHDTPADWTTALDGSIVTVSKNGVDPEALTFTQAQDAFNRAFGISSEMKELPRLDSSGAGVTDKIARIDHDHAGLYYDKDEMDTKLAAVNAGIKYIWDNQDEIKIESPGGDGTGYIDGEQGLLKDSATVGDTGGNNTCLGDWTTEGDKAVYQYQYDSVTPANSCWKFLYSLGATGADTADKVNIHSNGQDDIITVSKGLGGYGAGQTINADDNVFNVLKTLLEETVNPIVTDSAKITITETIPVSGNVEVGTDLAGGFNATINEGNISSYDPANLPNKVNIDQVGILNTGSASGDGGFNVSGVTVTGKAILGSQSVTASYDSQLETTPVYDSKGAVYTGITRSTSKSLVVSVNGQFLLGWGTVSDTANLPKTRANLQALPGSRIFPSSGTITGEVFDNFTSPLKTIMFVVLEGTYTIAQAKAKITMLNRSTNENHFDAGDVFVNPETINDAGGTSRTYSVVYRNLNVVSAPLPVDIILS